MRKISKLNSFILTIVFLILMFMIYRLNLVPIKYFLLIGGILLIFVFLFDFKLIRKKTGTVSRIIYNIFALILIALSCYAMTYINATYKFMNSIVADNFETITYDVVTSSNSNYNHIGDLYEKKLGYMNTDKNYPLAKIKIRKDVSYKDKKYSSVDEFTTSIENGAVAGIVVEDSYYQMLKEEYTNLSDTRVIKQYKVIVKKDNAKKQKVKETTKESFIVYISGIDTYGNISSVSRSDVNILAVVNPKTSQILLVSIPRDYYVQLHGTTGVRDKLTHAGIYGIDTSIDTINDLLDTKIDYFVRLNFSTLTKSIDLLDGIDVYSDREFTPWTNKNITIQKGMNHMDGETALAFARERHAYESGDRHRGENQQEIITAMINKMTDKNYITKYKDILTSLDGSFETSMRYEEMTNLFKMQINNNIKWNITSISLDGTGSMQSTYSMGDRKLYVMVPDDNTVNNAKENISKVLNGK